MERIGRVRTRDEGGFSLIELMVVILVVGILMAIAVPTYLGARARAADRAIQTDMRTGLAAALAFFAERGNWDAFDATQAEAEEPRLTWVDGGPPRQGEIAIHVHSGQQLLLVGLSSSGTFFCLAQVATSPATSTGGDMAFGNVDTTAECTGGW